MAHPRSHRGALDALNAAFDRIPGPELRLGRRAVPTFLVTGVAGLAVGALVVVALTAATGGDVLIALGLIPLGATASAALALVRKRRAGIERWVLLEHLAAILLAVTGALALAGEPVAPWLDRVFVGACVLFASGRIGCASAGCCFGPRCAVGIDPGPGHVEPGRRFPVALVEAACWVACAALGAVLVVVAPAGVAFGTTALVYAIARFFLEGLRADPRPRLLGVTESRWLALGLAAAAIAVLHDARQVSTAGAWIGGAGLAATAALWIGARRWLVVSPVDDARELVAFGRALAARGPDAVVHRTTTPAATAVATWNDTGRGHELYVSVSASPPDVLGPGRAELLLEAVGEGLGIRGETPEVVETGPGQFVTRFARDELHAPRPPDAAPTPDRIARGYFEPHSDSTAR